MYYISTYILFFTFILIGVIMTKFTIYDNGLIKHSFILLKHYLLLSIFFIFFTGPLSATDMLISKIIFPKDSVKKGDAFKIQFEFKNDNVQPAFGYTIKASITDSFGNSVFNYDTIGGLIMPYTARTMTLNRDIQLQTKGLYLLKMIIDYAEEINRSNDTARMPFSVYDPFPYLPKFKTSLNVYNYLNPSGMPSLGYGGLTITYPPYPKWKFLNTFITTDTTNPTSTNWLVQNALLPQKSDSNTFSISVNLDWVKGDWSKLNKLYSYSYLSDSGETTKPTKYDWGLTYTTIDTQDISNGYKVETEPVTSNFTFTSSTQTRQPVMDSIYRGCNIPNLDLNYSVYNSVTVPGYAGDQNACAPTSAANSMQWLENNFPPIKTNLSHRDKLVELSKLMNRPVDEGVFVREFIEGKLAFINKYKLPIRVKFQVYNLNSDVNSPDKIENDAINKGDGTHPKWEFLKQEMKDEEDVEMFIEFHKKVGNEDKVIGRHAIAASGVAEGGGNRVLWYKDDSYQGRAGGNTEKERKWDTLSNGVPVLNAPITIGDTTWYTSVAGVISESYDSTVVFKEKGTLQRIWEGFKGFGRWISGSDIVEVGSPQPEYMNIMGRRNTSSTPEWLVKNYLILGEGRDSLRSSFFDLTMLGINPANLLDSIQAQISYSKNVQVNPPTVDPKDWFYYKSGNVDLTSNESSSDPGAGILQLDFTNNNFPSYNTAEPDIKDSARIYFMNSFIDLNSKNFNSTTIPGYEGDEGAAGASSVASILDRLEKSYTQINTQLGLRLKLYGISKLCSRASNKGVTRDQLIKALVNFVDATKVPIGFKFQSFRKPTGNILSDGTFGHFAKNETPGSGVPDYEWLFTEMKANRIPAVELGW